MAFRASFTGKPPANNQLYWRALVLEDYDGETWKQNEIIKDLEATNKHSIDIVPTGLSQDYSIIAERSNQHWLFSLDVGTSDNAHIIQLPDYRLYSTKVINRKFQYKVTSYPSLIMDKQLPSVLRKINLQLPENSNPKTLQLANKLLKKYPEPSQRVLAMMNLFGEDKYYYTLSPPPVGPHQIDDFLLENKQGFCVHYASALTFMARATGIPARMVSGYQGGEWNPKANYLSVYQYMAHAWVEVWLQDRGWVRLDPTEMIAPQRVLEGFDAYFQGQDSYLIDNPFNSLRLREFPLLADLRMTLASIDYYWSVWVLGFDSDKQDKVLEQLLGKVTQERLIIFMLVSICIIGLAIAYSAGLLHFTRNKDRIATVYNKTCQLLHKKGVPRATHQGPLDYCQAVESKYPNIARDFTQFTKYYIALKYKPLTQASNRRMTKLFIKQSRLLRINILKEKPTD